MNRSGENEMETNKTLKSIRERTVIMEDKGDPICTCLVTPKEQSEEI